MSGLKGLFFPSLCHRCKSKKAAFLCDTCLLGVELGRMGKDGGNLFDTELIFLQRNKRSYKKIICYFAHVFIEKYGLCFGQVECEPELIFLKRYIHKNFKMNGSKTLYLIRRENNPILLSPMRRHKIVLKV